MTETLVGLKIRMNWAKDKSAETKDGNEWSGRVDERGFDRPFVNNSSSK